MNNLAKYLTLSLLLTCSVACNKQKEKETASAADAATTNTTEAASATNPSAAVLKADAQKIAAEFPNGYKITVAQVYEQMETLPDELKDKSFSKLYTSLLRRMVDSYILTNAANKLDIGKEPAVLADIKKNEEALVQGLYIENAVKKLMTDAALQKDYNEMSAKMPKDEKEINLKVLMVSSKDEAEALAKELAADPSKFAAAVAEKSVDSTTKANGGSLGYVRKADLPENFAQLVFGAKADSVLPVVIDMQGKFAIVYVGESRTVQLPKFEAIKAQLSKMLMPKFALQVLSTLKKDAGVQMTGLDGNPIPDFSLEQLKEGMETLQNKYKGVDVSKLDPSMVVAKFKDGSTITLKQVKESMKDLPPQLANAPFNMLFYRLLTRLVDQRLVDDAVKSTGLIDAPATKKKLQEIRENTIQKAYLEQALSKNITEAALKAKYQEVLKMIPKNQMEARIRHILVKTKEEAQKIIADIKGGKSFNEVVKMFSIDPNTKDSNGEIGYVKRSDVPANMANAIFSAANGTLIPEPVNAGKAGWSVIRVEDKRAIPVPTFDQLKSELTQLVKAYEAVSYINKIRDESHVKSFNIEGQPLSLTLSAAEAGLEAATGGAPAGSMPAGA